MKLFSPELSRDTRVVQQKVSAHYERQPFALNDPLVLDLMKRSRILSEWDRLTQGRNWRRVIDLGCGAQGKNLSFWLARSFWAQDDPQEFATDISLRSLKEARERHPGIMFVQADHRALPLAEGAFDAVWATGTIHHMPCPEDGLREALRILAAGGFLYLTVYDDASVYRWIYKAAGILRWLAGHGFRTLVCVLGLPVYAMVYGIANRWVIGHWRKIAWREIVMDFHDKLLVPVAHFFNRRRVEDCLQGTAEILAEERFAAGLMRGFLIQKRVSRS